MNATPEEIAEATAPRSDQLNADDLSGGRTADVQIVATKSYRDKGQVRIACKLEGYSRVYRPCKTMVRLLVACWGADSSAWLGRWIRLYTDPTVRFGGEPIGGLRISHASHIDGPLEVSLSETRGKRRRWVVQPLGAPQGTGARDLDQVLAEIGLSVAEADAWRAGLEPPRCPVAELDAGGREQLADWLAGGPERVAMVRAVPAPLTDEERAAIEAEEREGA